MKINPDKVKALFSRAKEKVATRRVAINTTPDMERVRRENEYMDRIRRVNPRLRTKMKRRSYVR